MVWPILHHFFQHSRPYLTNDMPIVDLLSRKVPWRSQNIPSWCRINNPISLYDSVTKSSS